MKEDVMVLKTWRDDEVRLSAVLEVGDTQTAGYEQRWSVTLTVAGRSLRLAALERGEPRLPLRIWGFSWAEFGLVRFWNWEAPA